MTLSQKKKKQKTPKKVKIKNSKRLKRNSEHREEETVCKLYINKESIFYIYKCQHWSYNGFPGKRKLRGGTVR